MKELFIWHNSSLKQHGLYLLTKLSDRQIISKQDLATCEIFKYLTQALRPKDGGGLSAFTAVGPRSI